MSSIEFAWQAIRPTPVEKGALVEPEATDTVTPLPWLHVPPGSALLLIACGALLSAAALQSSVAVVRRDGLREGLAQALPLTAIEEPVGRPASGARRRPHARPAQLHHLLQHSDATPWSQGTLAQR